MTTLEIVLLLAFAGTVGGTLRFLRTNYQVNRSAD
ncbi:protein of unknown function [Candidatus Methylocalor cossyra]|uniref:Uncharacterized protein n=1 Tax=Candidatus Methylocalor cossyra TaxID=3108543 RepID=A0ABM9NFR1_9GAMM